MQLREDVYNNFAKANIMKEIDRQLQHHKTYVDDMHKDNTDKFEEINKSITVEIYSAVKKAIKQMTKIIAKAQED